MRYRVFNLLWEYFILVNKEGTIIESVSFDWMVGLTLEQLNEYYNRINHNNDPILKVSIELDI